MKTIKIKTLIFILIASMCVYSLIITSKYQKIKTTLEINTQKKSEFIDSLILTNHNLQNSMYNTYNTYIEHISIIDSLNNNNNKEEIKNLVYHILNKDNK